MEAMFLLVELELMANQGRGLDDPCGNALALQTSI